MRKISKFRFLEHPSDAYVEAYGSTLEEAFESAALAMFEVMTDTSSVRAVEEIDVKAEGHDLCSLLYNWLETLLYYYGSRNLVFCRFKVLGIREKEGGYALEGKAWGERFDPSRHESRVEVKAITYSLMEVKREDGKYTLRFVLDI